MAITLQSVIDDIRERADLQNSEFVTDSEIISYINYSLGELQGLLVNSFGGNYFATSSLATVAAGATKLSADLPNDLYKILGIDLQLAPYPSNNKITLQPYNFNERNRANAINMSGYATQYATNYRYNIFNQTVLIQPPAVGQLQLLIWYVPVAQQFVSPAGTQEFTNNSTLNGWLEYVIVDVCIKCKAKEETDPSLFVRQKALLTERIRNEAQNRDQGSPATVSDVYAAGTNTDSGWAGMNYWGGGGGWSY